MRGDRHCTPRITRHASIRHGSEDAGSLLRQIRPALVWDMEVDETGEGIEPP